VAREREKPPVLGRAYRGRKATQQDVDRYDATVAAIRSAPIVRMEVRAGRTFTVRRLEDAWAR
jgi:hypothetical protein